MRIWTTLALLAALLAGGIATAHAYTHCTTSCLGGTRYYVATVTRTPPIWKRFFEALGLGCIGFVGAVWCIEHLDDKRRSLSTSLIFCCWLLVCCAFGLYGSALIPATWGWWL